MTSPKFLFVFVSLSVLVGCGTMTSRRDLASSETSTQQRSAQSSFGDTKDIAARSAEPQKSTAAYVSLNQVDQSQSMAEAMDRKIIRNADLTLEVGAPAEVQRKITSIAESLGGFVVTSESKLQQIGDSKQELQVNLVIRVPATQFGSALEQIRSTASRVLQEKMTGQDVTEEFIDLEARIKTQRRLNSSSWRS